MRRWFPLGVFTRNRIDWDIENIAIGACGKWSGDSVSITLGLWNNATDGTVLALYELNVYCTQQPQVAALFFDNPGPATNTALISMSNPLLPAIPGVLTASFPGPGSGFPFIQMVRADGGSPWSRRGAPLLLIPPGRQLSVEPLQTDDGGGWSSGITMFASFVWGRYEGN